MPRTAYDPACAIASALAVVGDWWSLLIVRDVAGGRHRFDQLQAGLRVSRRVLTERLAALVADGLLERRPYLAHPPRFEYHLTARGHGLLPVLVALQDWGARWVMGDGTLTATTPAGSAETERVQALVGVRVPPVALVAADGAAVDPLRSGAAWTVLYCFPGAYADARDYPPGWDAVAGTAGCTLQARTFRDRVGEFAARDAAVVGVSTQRPDQLAAFAAQQDLPFPLLSDAEVELAAALRLPTFRVGADRLKRLTLVVDADRVVRGVLYPIGDPAASVYDVLARLDALAGPAA